MLTQYMILHNFNTGTIKTNSSNTAKMCVVSLSTLAKINSANSPSSYHGNSTYSIPDVSIYLVRVLSGGLSGVLSCPFYQRYYDCRYHPIRPYGSSLDRSNHSGICCSVTLATSAAANKISSNNSTLSLVFAILIRIYIYIYIYAYIYTELIFLYVK